MNNRPSPKLADKNALSKMNLTSMELVSLFLNYELLWMNNKTIIEFGFHIIWSIMEISEGVIHL